MSNANIKTQKVIKPESSYEMIIGLEVHAQIISNSKLFSNAPVSFDGEPNKYVSPIDMAMPGMLPTLNQKCIEQAITTGLALNCKINEYSVFDRKNYFYPDLPQGYQISQFSHPIVGNGYIELENKRNIRIARIHIEQDAGKSIHDQNPRYSYIDLNRAGIGLMEIVTEPDFKSVNEVTEFMKNLRLILRYLGTCDGDMDKGSLRCDVNISVRQAGLQTLGTRVEIKNLNSIKNIGKAIMHEFERQVNTIIAGGEIYQETRSFDPITEDTHVMRSKEDATDYRYFPDPDLLPLIIDKRTITELKKNLPELPNIKKRRYMNDLNLTAYDADILVSDKKFAYFFESVVHNDINPKIAASWIITELFGKLNKAKLSIDESPISTVNFAKLMKLLSEDKISSKIAKQVFEIMFNTGEDPDTIIKRDNLITIDDDKALLEVINHIIINNMHEVEEYKNGKKKMLGFFVGEVMKMTEGKANPQKVNKILQDKLQ